MLSRSSACAQRAPSRLRVPLALRTHKLSSSSQGHETAQPSAVPLLSDDRIVVQPSYNRWVQLAPTTLAGLSIGAYFTVPGVLGPGLCKAQGVVAQAATDFSMSTLVPTLTLMPLVAATLAATLAKTSDEVGVRRLGLAASIVYPLGVYVLPAAAVAANSLAAFAPCYAVIGGIGFFAGYPQIPPFLLRWFPDRKGLALSLYGATFGSSVLFFAPLIGAVQPYFKRAPTRLGSLEEVETFTSEATGGRAAMFDGKECEVVVATARDLTETGFAQLEPGVFLLDGSNGACETMALVGGVVSAMLQVAAWSYRLPPKGWVPGAAASRPHQKPSEGSAAAQSATTTTVAAPPTSEVSLGDAMTTPQLYLLALGLTGVSATGLPFLMGGKFMILDIFGASAAGDTAMLAAAGFPSLMALANMGGRLAWGPLSDRVGAGTTLALFGLSVPALLLCPAATAMVPTDPQTALLLFRTGALGTLFCFAGAPVMIAPAAAELFGASSAGQIYRRLWITVPVANVIANFVVTRARDYSYAQHATRIADLCDDSSFLSTFGSPKSEISALLASKTLTLPLLLQIAPEGTPDPSHLLYDEVLYVLAATSATAFACNIAAFRLPMKTSALPRL